MRSLTIQGRVVADAQVKTTTSGIQYLEFRFANNEYGDDENTTFWVRVQSFNAQHIGLCKHITKGRVLTLTGDYRNKTYSAKDGSCQVDNDLRLTGLYFSIGGSSNDGGAAKHSSDDNINPSVVPTEAPKPAKKTKAKAEPVKSETVSVSDDDDLPF